MDLDDRVGSEADGNEGERAGQNDQGPNDPTLGAIPSSMTHEGPAARVATIHGVLILEGRPRAFTQAHSRSGLLLSNDKIYPLARRTVTSESARSTPWRDAPAGAPDVPRALRAWSVRDRSAPP